MNFIPNVWQVVFTNIFVRVGLFTLIYIASFIALAIFCPSLPMIMKLSTVVVWQVVFWCSNIGEGAFKCSFYLSPKVLDDSSMYLSSHSVLAHLKWYMTLLCLVIVSLSFGNARKFVKVCCPLKCTCLTYLPQMVCSSHWDVVNMVKLCGTTFPLKLLDSTFC